MSEARSQKKVNETQQTLCVVHWLYCWNHTDYYGDEDKPCEGLPFYCLSLRATETYEIKLT